MRLTHFLKEGKGIKALVTLALMLNLYILGYMTGLDKNRPNLMIFEPKIVTNNVAEIEEEIQTKNLVASKSGTKVYYVWCSGVSRIKPENKVYFDTVEEALNKGYKPASNCPGL
jgi:hypothetical protein